MRVFYGGIFKALASLFGAGDQGANTYIFGQPASSATDSRAAEEAAATEASRKAKIEADRRQGARASLLTDPSLNSTFGSHPVARKQLFGGA